MNFPAFAVAAVTSFACIYGLRKRALEGPSDARDLVAKFKARNRAELAEIEAERKKCERRRKELTGRLTFVQIRLSLLNEMEADLTLRGIPKEQNPQ